MVFFIHSTIERCLVSSFEGWFLFTLPLCNFLRRCLPSGGPSSGLGRCVGLGRLFGFQNLPPRAVEHPTQRGALQPAGGHPRLALCGGPRQPLDGRRGITGRVRDVRGAGLASSADLGGCAARRVVAVAAVSSWLIFSPRPRLRCRSTRHWTPLDRVFHTNQTR